MATTQLGSSAPLSRQSGSITDSGSVTRRDESRPTHGVSRGRKRGSDRLGLWAFLAAVLVMFIAVNSGAQAATSLGDRVLKRGMEGRDVRYLQRELKRVRLLQAPATARFGELTDRAVRRYQRSRCLKADGVVGAATVRAITSRARACRSSARRGGRARGKRNRQRNFGGRLVSRVATWYGPGLYGRRTACGFRLTKRLEGVAHRTLPCGARVILSYSGRSVTTKVVDRGPYTAGITFDVTYATAQVLGMRNTVTLKAKY